MKKILLTGGTGFLGSHLLEKLSQNKDYFIYVLKRKTSSLSRIQKYLEEENISFFDVEENNQWYEDFFNKYNVDIIIHTATAYGRKDSLPTEILKSNLIYPLNIIQEAIKHGVKLFINTDSYFNKPNQTYKTLLDYSLSKKSLNIWLEYLSQYIKCVNLRLEHIYGDNDNSDKFIEYVIQNIAIKKIENLDLTYGHQKRDFIHIDDVCNAYLKVIENYNKINFHFLTAEVGTGNAVPLYEFVNYVKVCSNSNTKLNFGKIKYREDEIMCSKADISILSNFGWKPEINYKDGIEMILTKYKQIYDYK